MEIFKKLNIKGYKAFRKGLRCRGYQFKENAVFEEEKAEVCKSGFHFCKNPFDVLDYYDLVNSNGETMDFAEVEASLDECLTDDDVKYCTKKIHIGKNVGINGFMQCAIDYLKNDKGVFLINEDYSQVATNNNSRIISTGDFSKVAVSENNAQIAATGRFSQIATSGRFAKIVTESASTIATSGHYSKIVAGVLSRVATSGDETQIAVSGDASKVAVSGDYSYVAINGDDSQVSTSGNYLQIAVNGDYSKMSANGILSKLVINGSNGVGTNIGINGKIKGKIGNWITLAEYEWDEDKDEHICVCVKSAQIDGILLKPDTWYILRNGQFVEYFDIDEE